REERVEMPHDVRLAADHEAVAALEAEHATARPAVHVMYPLVGESARPIDVVAVVRVSTVDHDVAALEAGDEGLERRIDGGRRDHQPDDARLRELTSKRGHRGRAARAFAHESLYRSRRAVVHHAGVAAAEQATHHVRTHPTESDHADLH